MDLVRERPSSVAQAVQPPTTNPREAPLQRAHLRRPDPAGVVESSSGRRAKCVVSA